MEHFGIRIDFRDRRIDGHVHKFDTLYRVHFSDTEIIRDFGGLVMVSADLKRTEGQAKAKDEKDFHNAIVKALADREKNSA